MSEYACKSAHAKAVSQFGMHTVMIGIAVTLVAPTAVAQTMASVPRSGHVIVIMDENSSFTDVFNNMTWLVNEGKANGYATNYRSDNGGSLFDYLWIASGSCESSANCTEPPGNNFNCTGNDCGSPITDDNIFRLMNNAGISWKVYAQSYAKAGGTPTTPDNANGTSYYRRHNGATWYSDILSNIDGSASKIVDLSQLTTDLNNNALPEYMIIAPDGNHDAHDCPVGAGSTCTLQQKLQAADQFLQNTLTPILNTPAFQAGGDGVIFVTFDECGSGTDGGCNASVYTAVIGPQVIPGTVSSILYKHENLLRTTLDLMGITTYPNNAATAADMSDFFTSNPNKPVVTVSSPANNSSVGSQVNVQASATPTTGASINGWHIYVDSVDSFSAGAVSSINTTLTLATGTHTLIARAWDTTGAFGDQTLTVTANSSSPTVSVSTPLNNSTTGSPVNIQASASPSAGNTISGWHIYDGNNDVFSAGAVSSINASIPLAAGSHTLTVRAWDTGNSSNNFGDQKLTIIVTASQPAVVVSTPPNNSNVINPTNIQASATAPSGTTISGWHIYVDNADVFGAGAVNSINTNLNMSVGKHTVIVRAWDSANTSGNFGDQTLILDVAQQNVAVNISTPMDGASVNSPVNIQASAQSAHPITGWHIYVDTNDVFGGQMNTSSINTNVAMNSGTHTVIVRAWDSTGAFGDQTITVTVPSTP